MHQGFRWALGISFVLALSVGDARAQYYGGYGGYGGWGGWGGGGSTVQGSIARGLGYYAMGAGMYNEETAQANSINENTIERWNEYMFQSQREASRREYVRRARMTHRDANSGDAIYARIRDKPQDGDIKNGDALNAILDQLTDPRIHSTAMRMIRTTIPGKTIKDIPFENASEAVTISLHELTGDGDWPIALRGDTFAAERQAYRDAITRAVKEDEEGNLSSLTLTDVNQAAARLQAKLQANPPSDKIQLVEGLNYIKTLLAMSRMLQKPQVDKILADIDSDKDTTLGSLLSFMHAYNLRFGPSKTDSQRAVYENLYPVMADARDRTLKDANLDSKDSTPRVRDDRHPVNFFQGLHLEHLDKGSSNTGTSTNTTTTPPPPQP